ncbi:MAG TPA: phosphoglycolate phosphatase, partial [Candidatus Angelobacter sp.]|nr:phosphoglycolate phosphatase [Candidatus Angelobacter sp.]
MAELWRQRVNRNSLAAPMARARNVLIFDLDGTLIDSAPDLHRSLNAVLAEQSRPPVPLAGIRAMVGDGAAKLVERGFADTGAAVEPMALPDLVQRFLVHYSAGRHALTTAFPGVAETLATLRQRGCRLGVCTNKPYAPTMEILELLGLSGLFGAVTGGDSLPVRKPDPGHLLGTLNLLGAAAEHAVMIGDSANDVAVARAAGVPAVVVRYGYTRTPV